MELQILKEEEIEQIHKSTLRVLENVGVEVKSSSAVEFLTNEGGRLEKGRVLLPGSLVEDLIRKCPSHLTIGGRGKTQIKLGKEPHYWHNLGGARDISDFSGRRRAAHVSDLEHSTKLLDAMDNVNSITPMFTPQDVKDEMMAISMYRYTVPNTSKPVRSPGLATPHEVEYIVKMANVLGDAPDILSMGVSPVSPLFFPKQIAETIIKIAELGIPLGPLPCPIVGATAPMTLAGALTQQNAELLASIVLAQIVNPGLPIIYRGRLSMMEPRTGLSVWGNPEIGMLSAATVQIAHYYGLPANVYGFATNSHTMNVQNGYERAFNAILPALAGADELSGVGELEAGVISSFSQIVLDNEIIANIDRILLGFEVTEETLAFDVINNVMNKGSRTFLSQTHTRNYLRAGEVLFANLAERRAWNEWEQSGMVGMNERAIIHAKELIEKHEVKLLDQDQIRDLDRIMREAEQQLPVG